MDTEELLAALRYQGELLRRSAGTDLTIGIPSCPGWTMAQLLRHTTKVHRWATWIVGGNERTAFDYPRPDDAVVAAEYVSGLADLIDTLAQAPESLAVWTIAPVDNPRRFWARRMAHETAMHRVDAQLGVNFGVEDFEPEFAADGLDELLAGMTSPGPARPGSDRVRTVSITPLDANAAWTVEFGASSVHGRRGTIDGADLSVFGMASDLYRWAWNRAGDDEVSLSGDVTLADRWRSDFTIGARRSS